MRITNVRVTKACLVTTTLAAALGATVAMSAPASAAAPTASTAVQTAPLSQSAAAKRTAAQAIQWYSSRKGSTAYEGYCEKAARLAWARTTHHPTAIDHWRSSDGARHTTGTPPKGAFVFWNISSAGHVGIADGKGGFWATSVKGRIGHASSVHYYGHYLGWKPGNAN
ncbi:CHAP domain-containing protein [Actinoallomurus acaciae]|uniref:CHAP domain-containing protein n=1 Tax=Actinoallomurus acaciae TaxID=502577 RepID=A0ABV5YS65_9ACTN